MIVIKEALILVQSLWIKLYNRSPISQNDTVREQTTQNENNEADNILSHNYPPIKY